MRELKRPLLCCKYTKVSLYVYFNLDEYEIEDDDTTGGDRK